MSKPTQDRNGYSMAKKMFDMEQNVRNEVSKTHGDYLEDHSTEQPDSAAD